MRTSRAVIAALLAAGFTSGCASSPVGRASSPVPARCAWPESAQSPVPAASPAAAPYPEGYRYHLRASPGAEELCVEVELPKSASPIRTWATDTTVQPFFDEVSLVRDGTSVPVPAAQNGWTVPACDAGATCRLRYRVRLGEAARTIDDFDHVMERDGAMLAPPSAWLLRPQAVHAPYFLAVQTAPGESFVSGLRLAPAPWGESTFKGDVVALDEAPYSAFGRFPLTRKRLPGGLVDLAFLHGTPSPAVETWIDRALAALTAYYGHFPIEHAALVVRIGEGTGTYDGHTMGDGGGAVLVTVGDRADGKTLADDWMLVHELVHVSFPDVSTPWIEEGLATYLEPIIRVRSGLCTVDDVWRSLVEGLPQGQPERGDEGLDVTDTWGRRYWGGALYWFVADVEIRKRTDNARSLDDALRAVNRGGGNVSRNWDSNKVLAMADAGTGIDVLVPLRRAWGKTPVRVDLDAMWKALGVAEVNGKMVYDDAAPLASVRKGILTGKQERK